MQYRNVDIELPDPEAVGKGDLSELWQLLLKVSVILLVILLAVDRFAFWLAPRMPFAWEVGIADSLKLDQLGKYAGPVAKTDNRLIEQALQERVNALALLAEIPADMPLHVHYVDGSTVNAMAGLGGHLFFYRGLLEKMASQEELDAVLAHEIGHIQHRDAARQLSRGLLVITTLSAMKLSSSGLNRWILGDAEHVAMLAHSRSAEAAADRVALDVSFKRYGHVTGVSRVFALLQREQGDNPSVDWLQSHPGTDSRLQAASDYQLAIAGQQANGTSAVPFPMTPLPAQLVVKSRTGGQ